MERDYPKGLPECGADALRFALASYLQQVRTHRYRDLEVISPQVLMGGGCCLAGLGAEYQPGYQSGGERALFL